LRSVNKILVLKNGQVAAFGERDQLLPRLGAQQEAALDTMHPMPKATSLNVVSSNSFNLGKTPTSVSGVANGVR
jgi:hypothetical protein